MNNNIHISLQSDEKLTGHKVLLPDDEHLLSGNQIRMERIER
jgi:hypothetical protein